MDKISVSQCMAEILCSKYEVCKDWNKTPLKHREYVIDNLKEYLISCVGEDMVIE